MNKIKFMMINITLKPIATIRIGLGYVRTIRHRNAFNSLSIAGNDTHNGCTLLFVEFTTIGTISIAWSIISTSNKENCHDQNSC